MIQIELDDAQTSHLEAAAALAGQTIQQFIQQAIRREADRTIPKATEAQLETYLQEAIVLAGAQSAGSEFTLKDLVGQIPWWNAGNTADHNTLGTDFKAAVENSPVVRYVRKNSANAAVYRRN